MLDLLDDLLDVLRRIALGSGPWMAFNATLATIPAVLSLVLFRRGGRRGAAWWCGVVAFVLFLPNAPYVITDLIHLRTMLQSVPTSRTSDMVPAGALAALVLWGVAAYAVCLAGVDRELARRGLGRWRVPVRTLLHVACAFGVVLGRLPRLHSWYVVTRPVAAVDGIVGVLHPYAVPLVLAMAVLFALAAAAVTAVGRAAWQRAAGLAGSARTLVAGTG